MQLVYSWCSFSATLALIYYCRQCSAASAPPPPLIMLPTLSTEYKDRIQQHLFLTAYCHGLALA